MQNAKEEFLREIEGQEVVCAKIGLDRINWGEKPDWKILKPNYSQEDFDNFCKELDFEYDDGYGYQELFGIILFENSFSDRHEYDGSERWDNHKMPTIEEVLTITNP